MRRTYDQRGRGRRLELHKSPLVNVTVEETREFVQKGLMRLRGVLGQDSESARMLLMKHLKRLVLTPMQMPSGIVYSVSGGVELELPAPKGVLQVVARDGIEPPTPAFSELFSTISVVFIRVHRLVYQ